MRRISCWPIRVEASRRVFILALLLSLLLIGTTLAETAMSATEVNQWIVPSPQAGTISEALVLAGPDDELIVESVYNSEWAEATGVSVETPKGTSELFPIRITKPKVKISCKAQPRWDGSLKRPTIVAPPDHAALVIAAEGVSIEGCEVRSGRVGIVVEAPGAKIVNNLLIDLEEGIRLINASDNVIKDNILKDIKGIGVHLEDSNDNLLEGNIIQNSGEGLFLFNAHSNQIGGDIYQGNRSIGLHLKDSDGNEFHNVIVTDNGGDGIFLVSSDENIIINSEISDNKGAGIVLMGSNGNKIERNWIGGNKEGLILPTGGEVASFTTPILDPISEKVEVEDPFNEVRQEKVKVERKMEELHSWIDDLESDLIKMIRDVELDLVQTSPMKLGVEIKDLLDKVGFIKEAVIPLSISPLLEEAEDEVEELKRKELGPKEDEIEEELDAVLEVLDDIDREFTRLTLILDDGEREAEAEEFDDLVDWLEQALSLSDHITENIGLELNEALERVREKLETAIVRNGRIYFEIRSVLDHLLSVDEKLPRPPLPDFTLQGSGLIGEITGSFIPAERITELREELVARLNESEEVLLKAERLGLLPIDADDLEFKHRKLPLLGGNIILGNFIQNGSGAPGDSRRGEHWHIFAGLVRTGCLAERHRGPEEGACRYPTEMIITTEIRDNDLATANAWLREEVFTVAIAEVAAYPNPVRGADTVRFAAEGRGITQIRMEIYDLSGTKVFDGGWEAGSTFEWQPQNQKGEVVANGVYLYLAIIKGKGYNGEPIRSEVRKLVVLR